MMVTALVLTTYLLHVTFVYSIPYPRVPPHYNLTSPNAFNCRLDADATGRYPTNGNPETNYYAEFNIPPLPSSFNPNQITFYIYFNMFFDGLGIDEYNQFVPQLMLGGCLCNSTESPDYKPIWCTFTDWYIGSQYFFTTDNHKTAHAVTGDLIKVSPGDIVYTQFTLDSSSFIWRLKMGVKGTNKVSIVEADKPFMGLIKDYQSWNASEFVSAVIGSDWELYGLDNKDNYPPYMNYTMNITTSKAANFWSNWVYHQDNTCDFQPTHYLKNITNNAETQQIVQLDFYYP